MPPLHTTHSASHSARSQRTCRAARNQQQNTKIHVRKSKSNLLRQFVEWATINVLRIERCTWLDVCKILTCDILIYCTKWTVHCAIYKPHKMYSFFEHSIKFWSTASYTAGVLFSVDTWTALDMSCPMQHSQNFVSYTDIPALFISEQLVFHPYLYFRISKARYCTHRPTHIPPLSTIT
jgi:hypothetical protein